MESNVLGDVQWNIVFPSPYNTKLDFLQKKKINVVMNVYKYAKIDILQ